MHEPGGLVDRQERSFFKHPRRESEPNISHLTTLDALGGFLGRVALHVQTTRPLWPVTAQRMAQRLVNVRPLLLADLRGVSLPPEKEADEEQHLPFDLMLLQIASARWYLAGETSPAYIDQPFVAVASHNLWFDNSESLVHGQDTIDVIHNSVGTMTADAADA